MGVVESSSSSSILYSPRAATRSDKEISMGTTIIAMGYKNGVIVGADTRTSASGYVSNRFANKLTFVLDPSLDHYIHPYNEEQDNTELVGSTCCICRSGSAADTQYLADAVRMDLISRQIQLCSNNGNTVTTVANLLKQRMNEDDYQASLLCAGYDHVKGRGIVYSIMPGGTCMEETSSWAISGSGSTYIHGFLSDTLRDSQYNSLEETEAITLVTKALRLAMTQDGSSGGFIRIYVIDRHGRREIILPHSSKKQSNKSIDNDTNDKNLKSFAPPIRHHAKHQ